MMQQGPWAKYQQPDLGRTVIRGPSPQPTPQTPVQRRRDELEVATKERELMAPQLSVGQKAVDEEFAKNHYLPYTAGGGFADTRKQLDQLRKTSEMLKSGMNLTGPIIGRLPDAITAFTNPDAITAREQVEEPVQRSLRQILGAQFTENEGKRLIARSYNPSLPEVENRKRVARLRIQLTLAAKAKQSAVGYFDKNGTLKGWKGRLWNIDDFDPESNKGITPAKQAPRKPQGIQFLGFEQ